MKIFLVDGRSNSAVTPSDRMRIPREHRLDSVADDLSQVRVIDASGSEVGDVGVAALVGADV